MATPCPATPPLVNGFFPDVPLAPSFSTTDSAINSGLGQAALEPSTCTPSLPRGGGVLEFPSVVSGY